MALQYGVLRARPDRFKREDNASTPHLQIRAVDTSGQPWRIAVNVQSDSGSEVARVFCAACGTPLWSDGPNLPFLAVRVGSLDDAPAGGPALHIWTEAAPRWHAFEPSAVVFPQGPVAAAPS